MSIKDSEIREFKDSRIQGFNNSKQGVSPLNRWRMKYGTWGINLFFAFSDWFIDTFSPSAVEMSPCFRSSVDSTN
jgi:hypothetical protein